MKTHNLVLTTEQLLFVASDLIRAQLQNQSLVEHHCETICETEEEALEQKEWHINMLRELQKTTAIQKCYSALDRISDAIL